MPSYDWRSKCGSRYRPSATRLGCAVKERGNDRHLSSTWTEIFRCVSGLLHLEQISPSSRVPERWARRTRLFRRVCRTAARQRIMARLGGLLLSAKESRRAFTLISRLLGQYAPWLNQLCGCPAGRDDFRASSRLTRMGCAKARTKGVSLTQGRSSIGLEAGGGRPVATFEVIARESTRARNTSRPACARDGVGIEIAAISGVRDTSAERICLAGLE